MSKLDSRSTTERRSQAEVLLKHVAAGVRTARELAKVMGLSRGRISQLTAQLRKEKKLAKLGRIYALPKTRKFIADSEAPNATQAAPAKEPWTEIGYSELSVKSGFPATSSSSRGHAQNVQKPLESGPAGLSKTTRKALQFHKVQRPEWSPYTSPNTLPQKAGVSKDLILRVALKELADNAADETDRVGRSGRIQITRKGDHVFMVSDLGDGLSDSPEEVANLFSLNRAMLSSKLWRLPTRGAQGLGTKVAVGAVASGDRHITVCTRNMRCTLRPRIEDGHTEIQEVAPIDYPIGTQITVEFDEAYPCDPDAIHWAEITINLARHGLPPFSRRPCAHWFDADHFALLLREVSSETTLREFLSHLEGCTSDRLCSKIAEQFGKRRLCHSFNRDEAARLLSLLQSDTKPIKAERLGRLGPDAWLKLFDGYACQKGVFRTGARSPYAQIPFLVECWAKAEGPHREPEVALAALSINRSPSVSQPRCIREKGNDVLFYSNPRWIRMSLPRQNFTIALNITSPFIPTLSDSKAPDLGEFLEAIKKTIENAVRRAQRNCSYSGLGSQRITQRDAVREVLDEAIARAKIGSDGELYSFGQRNLFYRVRELVKEEVLPELDLKYKNFTEIITDYENEHGEIEMMTRDPRGIFLPPHGGVATGLGTKSVAVYQRPAWSYSSILFIEKEDLIETLRQAGFLDRWDCFAVSSKGFSTRGAKNLIDKIAEARKDEPTQFFCVHDADAAGTLIAATLSGRTKARAARSAAVIDLGFFPWAAVAEGLEGERADRTQHRRPVAGYVKERDRINLLSGNPDNEPVWEDWLQNWRIELNTKTPEEFVRWMESAFERCNAKKVAPPFEVFTDRLESELKKRIDDQLCELVLRDTQSWRDQQAALQFSKVTPPNEDEVRKATDSHFEEIPEDFWTDVIRELVENLTPEPPPLSPKH